MSVVKQGDAGQPERVTVRDLRGPTRGVFALVGMSGLGAGGIAVFETANQAGSVALLAVGSVASLLAAVGKVPLRWVISGHEFDMSETAARETADVLASHLTPSETAELAGRLAGMEGGGRSQMAVAMLDYVAFEQAALARVMDTAIGAGWSSAVATKDRPYDLLIMGPNQQQVPVEFKLIRNPKSLPRILSELRNRVRTWKLDNVVVVISGTTVDRETLIERLNDPKFGDGVEAGPNVEVVFFEDSDFEGSLTAALERSFARQG